MWLVLVLACSPSSTSEALPAETFDATLAGLADDTARHGATVAAAGDLGAITTAEEGFWDQAGADLGVMDDCMDAFMGCGMDGGMMMSGPMDDWHGMTGDTRGAMEDHHEAMAGCGSVEACQALEEDWQEHMEGMFEQMEEMEPAWDDDCEW